MWRCGWYQFLVAFSNALVQYQLFLVILNHTFSSKEKIQVEERECQQEYCLPKCPLYHLKELNKQDDDTTKLVATFIVDKVSYPIGELQYQTMRLEQKEFSELSLWKMQKSSEFNKKTKQSLFTIKNLIVDRTYFPIYEFHLTFNSTAIKDPTKIAWECKGKVTIMLHTYNAFNTDLDTLFVF